MNATIDGRTFSDVPSCPRCGGAHAGVEARRLKTPSLTHDERGRVLRIAWWSTCPRTLEPMLATEEVKAPPFRVHK